MCMIGFMCMIMFCLDPFGIASIPHLSSHVSSYASDAAKDPYQMLPSKRLLRVAFLSSERLDEFHRYWHSQEERFHKYQSNSSLFIAYPHLDDALPKNISAHNSWTSRGVFRHAHPFLNGPLV